MINDTHTARYQVFFGMVMFVLFSLVLGGAVWISSNPMFNTASVAGFIKRPLYIAELYTSDGSIISGLINAKERVAYTEGEAGTIAVLAYHGVTEGADESDINISIEQFKDHMFSLKREGYTSLTLAEFSAFLRGEISIPKRSVLITFDDGRTDSFYNSDPILAATGYNAVMYAIGSFSESEPEGGYYLSRREIAYISDSDRWEIGSHSYDAHKKVPQDSEGTEMVYFYGGPMWLPTENRLETIEEFRARIGNDFKESRESLERITGAEITSLSFPFGNYGQGEGRYSSSDLTEVVIDEASEYFDLLFYQASPQQYFTQAYPDDVGENSSFVRRITITSDMSGEDLIELLRRGSAKSLPYTAALDESDGWVDAWGSYKVAEGVLRLDSEGRRSGAGIILDGTRHLENYRVSASASSDNGSNVVLMLRHNTEGDTVGCNYGSNFLHINQTIHGEERVIRGVDGTPVMPSGEVVEIGARVDGRRLTCYLNGEAIVETEFLDPVLEKGGVGFKTWNEAGSSAIVIHSLSILPLEEGSPNTQVN